MASHLCLITCAKFDREILAIQSSSDFRDVRFKTLAVDCDLVEAGWSGLGESVEACRRQGCSVCIVGSYCLVRAAKELRLEHTCAMAQKGQCYEWVADKEVLDKFLQDGALPVLPGWLKDWERNIDIRWPSGRKDAQAYYREMANKVVLLDTGVHPKIDHELKSFARFLRFPYQTFPVGLGYFKLNLGQIFLSWRVEREREGAEDHKAAVRQRMSEYARMGQLMGAVTNARSVDDVRAGTIELFRVLLSPQGVVFHAAESLPSRPSPEGSPWDRILTLNADYAWTDDRKVLYLRISHEREFLGVLEVTGLGEGRGATITSTWPWPWPGSPASPR